MFRIFGLGGGQGVRGLGFRALEVLDLGVGGSGLKNYDSGCGIQGRGVNVGFRCWIKA